MSDTETPIVTEEERLTTRRPAGPLLERWLEEAGDLAVERVAKMVQILTSLRGAAISQTYPEDWVIHTSTDHDGTITRQVGYLQDTGAQRAGKVFGIEVGKPLFQREDDPADGTYTYTFMASGVAKLTGERTDAAMGSRWSGDPFFQRGLKDGEKPDPSDVMKAAYANLHGRIVRELAGLSGVPLDVLKASGIDITRCQYVGYGKGARGGESVGAATGGAEPTVGFGKGQGKRPAELDDKDLAWYLGAYEKNVADEGKARFKRANQHVLDALTRERDRRAQKDAHVEATGSDLPTGSRGQKLTDLRTRLMDATKKDPLLLSSTVRLLSKEHGDEVMSLTDLTDVQLDALAKLDDQALEAAAVRAKEKK